MLLMVDAISILGGDKLPVDDWNVDMCVTASQKCLMTPPGLAFISVSDKAWTKIKSKKINRSYYLDLQMYQKYIQDGYAIHTSCDPSVRVERGMRHDTRRGAAGTL